MKPIKIGALATISLIIISCSFFMQPVNPGEVGAIVSATLTAEPISPAAATVTTEAPAVPTASPTQLQPESRHPAELRVAFIGPDRNLYSWSKSTGTVKLQDFGDITDLKISEDGTLIAFTRQNASQQSSLWCIGFDGTNPRELISWNDLAGLKVNAGSMGAAPSNLQWIPGTHTLTFTSYEVFEGPGFSLNNDLITVDGDSGAWSTKFKPGQGGVVTYSPDGLWMAVTTADSVAIKDINGNAAPGTPLYFSSIMTYSEYQYYPTPVWSADGTRLGVFIPTFDPLAEPRQAGSLWTMDVQGGEPVLQSRVTPQFIGPVSISPDLAKFFYVKEFGKPEENRRELRTAQINGEGEAEVFTGGIPVVWDWNPNSEVFAYQTSQEDPVTVSQMNGSVGNLPDTNGAYWFSWVDTSQFLFSRVSGEKAELFLGKWNEGSQLIAALPVSDLFRMQVDYTR